MSPQRSTILGAALLSLAFIVAVFGGFFVGRAELRAQSFALREATPLVTLDAATTSIRWAGYSTSTYTGLLLGTGFKGANQICNTLYPGSHWANTFEILHLGTQYPWSSSVWLADYWYDGTKDCAHFTSNVSSGSSATNADTKTVYPAGVGSALNCNSALFLACVYQP